jgi:hypothetical protein
MTTKTKSEPQEEPKTIDPREESRNRAEQCGREIEMVLAKHRCRIQPYLTQQPVGNDGSTSIVAASFGIAPI